MSPLCLTVRWLTLTFWSALVVCFALALLPMPEFPEAPLSLSDKAQHLLVFIALTVLGSMAYPQQMAIVYTGLVVYGGLIELAQGLTPWRQPEWLDWVADMTGVVLGALGWGFIRRQAHKAAP